MNSNLSIEKPSNEELTKIFKALSDPTRLEILRELKRQDRECSCGLMGERFDMSQPTMSYHMKTLREAGLMITRKEAREKFVRLDKATFERYLPGFLDVL